MSLVSRVLAAFAGLGVTVGAAQAGCPAGGAPCALERGGYHAAEPDGPARGAVVFLHGLGGSGEGILRIRDLVQAFTSRGYVVVAPDGAPLAGPRRPGWAFRAGVAGARDDYAFLRSLKADVMARFGVDPGRILLSGFSNGAFMVSYVACREPDMFMAYAPVAGTFWRPQPAACAGPVKLLQTHGWSDRTVPIEGRMVRGDDARDPASFVQGDVFAALDVWRVANGCSRHDPDRFETDGRFWRRAWQDCAPGSALTLAVHAGGHSVPAGWAGLALDWFEAETLSN